MPSNTEFGQWGEQAHLMVPGAGAGTVQPLGCEGALQPDHTAGSAKAPVISRTPMSSIFFVKPFLKH